MSTTRADVVLAAGMTVEVNFLTHIRFEGVLQ